MQEQDSTDFDFENVNDLCIEELLVNVNPGIRQLGLVFLDAKKREKFCGLLKTWSNNRDWLLGDADIAEIWEATMTAIHKNVERKRFRKSFKAVRSKNGTLNAYVRKIIFRKAITFLRQRIPILPDVDIQKASDNTLRYDKLHETHYEDQIRLIRARYPNLSSTEKRIMDHDVRLYIAKDGKSPSPDELKAACDADGDRPLTKEAVRSAHARALRKLRGDENGKGGLL